MTDDSRVRSPVQPGDMVGGKYRVERVLGAGGMGVVVAAVHTDLGHPVALKFILPDAISGADAVERFMREARAVARLKSEHVARVFDVGRDGADNPYMVLELLEGMDLAKLSKQRGPLAVADAVEYVLQACEGLLEAHGAGIVHRDLKPQNIFVTRRLNGMPLVKVLDFGIAKSVGAAAAGQHAITDSHAVIGSPLYMAPEHMRSARAADTRSDIWSLGVILYELLGGEVPFDGETVTEICIRVVNEPPRPLLSLRPGLDPALVDITMRCLDKDPTRRWQNVAMLAAALEPFSRSAQQGALIRPWRSLEDTMDSSPAGRAMSANDTGPATAITLPGAAELVRKAPEPAAQATPSSASDDEKKGASTRVSWSDDSAKPPAPRRTAPLAVGAALAVALAAGAVFVLRTPAPKTTVSAASAPPPSASAPEPPRPVVSAQPAAEPPVVANAPPPKPTPVPTPSTKGKAPAGRPAAKPASAPAAPPAPSPAETQAPNGAPILR